MLNHRLGGLAALLIAFSGPLALADETDADSPPPSVEGSAPATGSGSAAGSASASGGRGEGAAAASGAGPSLGLATTAASALAAGPATTAAIPPGRVAFTSPADAAKQTSTCLAEARSGSDKVAQRKARNACLTQKRKLAAEFKRGLGQIKTSIATWNRQIVAGLAACRKAGQATAAANIQKWQLAMRSWVAQIQRYGTMGGERPAASPPSFPDACAAGK